ncbi:leucyl-tRNA synthetase [Phlyctochytrium arcticum]|nr:leucyl-tRNA synthetase [Phlyctochytrium arcticum]
MQPIRFAIRNLQKQRKPLSSSYICSGCRFQRRAASTLSGKDQIPPTYNVGATEAKWRSANESIRYSQSDQSKPTSYVLSMFPYPSGNLHMGHVRVYTIADVISRYKQMTGHKVLHPMGWDSFGLPAENAAITHNVEPRTWTMNNIARMKSQLKAMGTAFDWSREIATSDPSYYKWTQYLFLQLHKAGLVYQKEAVVNWDPVDQTVLANEQVDAEGRAERSGAIVEKKNLKQWFIRTTAYSEELLKDAIDLQWPKGVKQLQANWIGRAEGVTMLFEVQKEGKSHQIDVFTPHPAAAHRAVFIAVGIEHPIIKTLVSPEIQTNISAQFLSSHTYQKKLMGTKIDLRLANSVFPSGLPVYVVNYVDPEDAVLEVPTEDTQAMQFAAKYNISLDLEGTVHNDKGHTCIQPAVRYKLRDWLISRQRKWGTPIPIIHCEQCGPVPVPENALPYTPSSQEGETCHCPKCGNSHARPERDTMDTFVDSSWYWLRYCDPHNATQMADPQVSRALLPVDIYIGGVEHSIMHLLYARFIGKFLHKQGFIDIKNGEPFPKLLTQGMVQGRTFRQPTTGRYLKPEELEVTASGAVLIKATGDPPLVSWEKMSKSKFNGIDPTVILDKHGIDATRLYTLYKAAPQDELAWDDGAIVGMERWLSRVWTLALNTENQQDGTLHIEDDALRVLTHSTIQELDHIMTETFAFNVALAKLIQLTSAIESSQSVIARNEAFKALVSMLAPFAPCITLSLWAAIGKGKEMAWPVVDQSILRDRMVSCAVMINGKTRGTIHVPESQIGCADTLQRLAKESKVGKKWLVDGNGSELPIQKVVMGKGGKGGRGRMISFITSNIK